MFFFVFFVSGWFWSDESPVNIIHWKANEPPDPSTPEGARERCAAWDAVDGTYGWVAFPCQTIKANYACKMQAGDRKFSST
jgi:hypothetical protein